MTAPWWAHLLEHAIDVAGVVLSGYFVSRARAHANRAERAANISDPP